MRQIKRSFFMIIFPVIMISGCNGEENPVSDFIIDGIIRIGAKLAETVISQILEKAGDSIMGYFSDSAKKAGKTFNDEEIIPFSNSDTLGRAVTDNDFRITGKYKGKEIEATVNIKANDIVFHRKDLNSPWELTETSKNIISDRLYRGSIQFALQQKGFYDGRIDGLIGDRTKQAIRKFQQSVSVNPDGELVGITLEKLFQ